MSRWWALVCVCSIFASSACTGDPKARGDAATEAPYEPDAQVSPSPDAALNDDSGAPPLDASRDSAQPLPDAHTESDAALEDAEIPDAAGGDDAGDAAPASECPCAPSPVPCEHIVCEDDQCVTYPRAEGYVLGAEHQTFGDCLELRCDGAHNSLLIAIEDVPAPSETCRVPTCLDGAVQQLAVEKGTPCASGICDRGECVPSLCGNEELDGQETDIDCGGAECAACPDHASCEEGDDCSSEVCSEGTCAEPSCSDEAHNGNESDVDCGGETCEPCATGEACALARDCASGVCTGRVCRAPACNDGATNGLETAQDCGGPECAPCGAGRACQLARDCASAVCTSDTCQAPSCGDAVQNGGETDLGCGGPSCPSCELGEHCALDRDCDSGFCKQGTCSVPNCFDGYRNALETDVDCGGVCYPCAIGERCEEHTDCAELMRCSAGDTCSYEPNHGARRRLQVKALERNPIDGTLYALVGDTDPEFPSSVVAFAPGQYAPAWSISLGGSVAWSLAVSDDGSMLYAGMYAPRGIVPIDLTTRQAGALFELGSELQYGLAYPLQLAVRPGHADTVAATLGFWNSSALGGVHLYEDGQPLHPREDIRDWQISTTFEDVGVSELVFTGPDELYAFDGKTSGFKLSKVALRAEGLEIIASERSLVGDYDATLEYGGGKLFSSTGSVIDPAGPTMLGQLGFSRPMTIADDGSRVYYGHYKPGIEQNLSVVCFDPETFGYSGGFRIDTSIAMLRNEGGVTYIERWGDSGIALSTIDPLNPGLILLPNALAIAPGCAPHATPSVPIPDVPAPDASNAVAQTYYLDANDLERDPVTGGIYASLSTGDPRFPNHVVAIAADAPGIAWSTFAGSFPRPLSASDDGETLWVGLDGAPEIRRIDTSSGSIVDGFTVQRDFYGNQFYASSIAAVPGDAGALAVIGYEQGSTRSVPLTVYDDGVDRFDYMHNQLWRAFFPWLDVAAVQLVAPDRIHASGNGFEVLELSETGIEELSSRPIGMGAPMVFAGDKVFGDYSYNIIDLGSGEPELYEQLPIYTTGPLWVSPSGERVYIARDADEIACVDPHAAIRTGTITFEVPTLPGWPVSGVSELVRFGEDGFALRTAGAVVLLPHVLAELPAGCELEASAPPAPVVPPADVIHTGPPLMYGVHFKPMDIVRNRETGAVYVAAARDDTRYPNQVLAFEPGATQVSWTVRVGSGPQELSLDDDSDTLYVGLENAAAVMPIDLATRTAGDRFRLGWNEYQGVAVPLHLTPVPGGADAIAVTATYPGLATSTPLGGLHIYEGGLELFPSPSGDPGDWAINQPGNPTIQPSQTVFINPTTAYAMTLGRVGRVNVTPLGLELVSWQDDIHIVGNKVELLEGRLFVGNSVLDPDDLTPLGSFNHSALVAYADDGSRAYFISIPDGSYSNIQRVRCFDANTFQETGSVTFLSNTGPRPDAPGDDMPTDIELWGDHGLVIRTFDGVVLLPDVFEGVPGCE
jgi:hypothetical protein